MLREFFLDPDGDGYGNPVHSVMEACPRAGITAVLGDCGPDDATVYPGAPDLTCNGLDEDCDGDRWDACRTCDQVAAAGGTTGTFSLRMLQGDAPQPVQCLIQNGQGWSLAQRTVWDWTTSQPLLTDSTSLMGTTVGQPSGTGAYRLAGRFWPSQHVNGIWRWEVMVRVTAPDVGACGPFTVTNNTGPMTVVNGLPRVGSAGNGAGFLGLAMSTTDVDQDITAECVNTYLAVPWFYGGCCNMCPTFRGYFGVGPLDSHPMAAQAFVPTAPAVCAGKTLAVGTPAGFYGLDVMEIYLR